MSQRSAPPGIRVKLPCQGEQEFQQRYAAGIAANGFPVPTANLRPVGSRVHLVLELKSGEVVSGEGVVESHTTGGARSAMMVRFERLDDDSIVFALRPAAAAPSARAVLPAPERPALTPPRPPPAHTPPPTLVPSTPSPAPLQATAAARPALTPVPAVPRPPAAPPAATPPPRPAPVPLAAASAPAPEDITADGRWEELFGEEEGAAALEGAAPSPDAPRPSPASPAPEAAPPRAEEEPRAREAAADAPEGQLPGPPVYRDETVTAGRGKGPFLVAAVGLVAIALAVGGYAAMTSREPAAAPPAAVRTVAPDPSLEKVAALLVTADRRIAEGRLAGGDDAALTYLDAARALAPRDARVEERLNLLADTFEAFCARALDRHDVVEARVHLAAAEKAAPGRKSLEEKRARLEAMAPRTRDRR